MADWEMRIVRKSEQKRASDGKRRTVGTYQIFHGDEAQTGFGMKGMVAETRGPGANAPAGNNRRVEAGRYPLSTQDGTNYDTIGYKESESHERETEAGHRAEQYRQAIRDPGPSGTGVPVEHRLHQPLYVAPERRGADRLCR